MYDILFLRSPWRLLSIWEARDVAPGRVQLHFRMTLGKSLCQPCFIPYASVGGSNVTDRPDVFFVTADGANLDEVVAGARDGLARRGLPVLARFREPSYAYLNLLEGDHVPLDYGGVEVVPPGTFDSPARRNATLDLGRLVGAADPRDDIRAARSRRSASPPVDFDARLPVAGKIDEQGLTSPSPPGTRRGR
jgi:hypothetical protein